MLHLVQPGQCLCLHCRAQSLQPPRSLNDLDQIPTHHPNIPDIPTVLASRTSGQIPLPSLQGRQHPRQRGRRRRLATGEPLPGGGSVVGTGRETGACLLPSQLVAQLLVRLMQLLVLHPPRLGLQSSRVHLRLQPSDTGSIIIRGPTGPIEQPACTHTDKTTSSHRQTTDKRPITRTISTTLNGHTSITIHGIDEADRARRAPRSPCSLLRRYSARSRRPMPRTSRPPGWRDGTDLDSGGWLARTAGSAGCRWTAHTRRVGRARRTRWLCALRMSTLVGRSV